MGIYCDLVFRNIGFESYCLWEFRICDLYSAEQAYGLSFVVVPRRFQVSLRNDKFRRVLTKKRVRNDGYVQKYYVENSHEGSVSKEEFAVVRADLARRSSLRGYSNTGKSEYSSKLPFSGKIFCSNCGSKFNRNIWGTGKYNIYKGLDEVEHEFTEEEINVRLTQLQQELISLVRLNAKTGLDTRAYDNEYGQLAAEIERFRAMRQKFQDEDIFRRLIEKVSVKSMMEVTFVFKTGIEVREVLG